MSGEKKLKIKLKKKEGAPSAATTEGNELFKLLSKIAKLLDGVDSLRGVEIEAEEIVLEGVMLPTDLLAGALRQATAAPAAAEAVTTPPKPTELESFKFEKPVRSYVGKFEEVKIGATAEEGGSRAFTLTIGGSETPAMHAFEGRLPHRPVVAYLVFDEDPGLPETLLEYYGDVKDDPVAWAKKCVEEFGAKMIFLDLRSTDPHGTNRSAEDAAKTVKAVLEAVSVPLAICVRSGDMKKDVEVLKRAAEVAAGENVVLYCGSLTLPAILAAGEALADEIYEYFKAAKEHGHVVVAYQPLNLPGIAVLNKAAMEHGVPKSKILIDPGSVAVGYAVEMAISAMDAIYNKALVGDESYQMPLMYIPANAWMYRESYDDVEEWGDTEQRGHAWEIGTAMAALMSGAHLLVMLDPYAIDAVENFLDRLYLPKIESVEGLLRHLPGSNCKACGFEACKELADAVLKGEADVDKCQRLGDAGKRAVKKLLSPPSPPVVESEEIASWIKELP
ncbi:MAG: CO dehydrogenase/acetyl-CoA synthase delta subunit [Candidatus Alkanophagales archaeon MCA70_species_2]|nr:CO dehydrogenase/acetyl-CoA synthase delta subunit [Candidatus Alkanophaga liquidiphilum]